LNEKPAIYHPASGSGGSKLVRSTMSKAFVSEDVSVPDAAADVVRRTESMPITPRGLAELSAEHRALRDSGEDSRRFRQLSNVLETVYLVPPVLEDGRVAFGTCVRLETEHGELLEYEIVGPDEADPTLGRISATSAVARALLGKRAGDEVTLRRPKGDIDVIVREVGLPRT
jgi:transcription elongation GreA/GreB family factor